MDNNYVDEVENEGRAGAGIGRRQWESVQIPGSPARLQRKPLGASRLPVSGCNTISRLPTAGSRLKRARSPDIQDKSADVKKSRTDLPSLKNPPKTAQGLKSSRSASSLHKVPLSQRKTTATTASKGGLSRHQSSTSLRKQVATTTTTVKQPTPSVSSSAFKFRGPEVQKSQTASRFRAPNTVSHTRTTATDRQKSLNETVVSTGAPKKRPAWDLKGRIQDMEAKLSQQSLSKNTLEGQLADRHDRLQSLEEQNVQLSGDLQSKELARENAVRQIARLEQSMRDAQDQYERAKRAAEEEFEQTQRSLKRELSDLQFTADTLTRQKSSLEGELEASRREVKGLLNSVADLTAAQASVKASLDSTQCELGAANSLVEKLKAQVAQNEATICSNQESISEFEARERWHESQRRVLHNTIQELKGNIRVFCRVRPLLSKEEGSSTANFTFPDPDGKVLELDKLPDHSLNKFRRSFRVVARQLTRPLHEIKPRGSSKYDFTFDKVFQPEATQLDVFGEISQLVQSALDGYNVCIFAYGQTGAGKTHTMEGSLDAEETKGVIPRTVGQIFTCVESLQAKGWQYKIEVAVLEIYNETIRDLLEVKPKDTKYEIRMVSKDSNEVFVSNLSIHSVTREDEVFSLLRKAGQHRAVAATNCNERSSRSHSVFQMKLTGTNPLTGEDCQGVLNLVDLAGSERVKDSGSKGDRLKEAQKINTSLLDLGSVITALGKGDDHVPYRNSKLTHLLQHCLGGNAKTLMFVNVSPREECFTESLNALRFATQVNETCIGTAKKVKK